MTTQKKKGPAPQDLVPLSAMIRRRHRRMLARVQKLQHLPTEAAALRFALDLFEHMSTERVQP